MSFSGKNDTITLMKKEELAKLLKIDDKTREAEEIQQKMLEEGFWNARELSAKLSQRLAYLNDFLTKFANSETEAELADLEKDALFDEEFDEMATILSIHAGAGGTEAQDWAQMLERMYLRYCEKENFLATILDSSEGEEAGIKSCSIKIDGINAYGKLKSENGVHRLVRISPFDADKARHTSFALVEVIPEFDDIGDVDIDEKDLKVDVFRSGGHGGQSVNTTDSAVRITHLPTKITVSVQNERSQLQNRETAMKILKIKLKKKMLDSQKEKERDIKGGHISAEWGNQIRSYVLQPYQQVKDHRTQFESANPEAVLDGDLNGFIDAYLKWQHEKN